MVTPDELRSLLKRHRWTIAIGTSGRQHVYAAKRREGKKLVTRYIGTANKLNGLTEEDILGKLYRSDAMRLAHERGSNSDQAPCQNTAKTGSSFASIHDCGLETK